MADLLEPLGHLAAQGLVEFLAVDPDAGPFFGWILLRSAVRLAHQLSLGQNPRNHGELFSGC